MCFIETSHPLHSSIETHARRRRNTRFYLSDIRIESRITQESAVSNIRAYSAVKKTQIPSSQVRGIKSYDFWSRISGKNWKTWKTRIIKGIFRRFKDCDIIFKLIKHTVLATKDVKYCANLINFGCVLNSSSHILQKNRHFYILRSLTPKLKVPGSLWYYQPVVGTVALEITQKKKKHSLQSLCDIWQRAVSSLIAFVRTYNWIFHILPTLWTIN